MREISVDGLLQADMSDTVRAWFEPYGRVIEAKVFTLSIGAPFGYVTMEREEDAARAIRALNRQVIGPRTLLVMWARPIRRRAKRQTTAPTLPFTSES